MKLLRLSIFFICFIVFACVCDKSNQLTDDEKKLAIVYCQLNKLEREIRLPQIVRIDSAQTILVNYGLTQNKYDSLVSAMNAHPQKWRLFYQFAKKQLAVVDSTQID